MQVEEKTQFVVTWSTRDNTNVSICKYGIDGLTSVSENKKGPSKFIDGGKAKRVQYIHRVALTNLKDNTRYLYHCGSPLGWSALFTFHTPPTDANWSPTLLIYGDLGNENAQSLPRLQEEIQNGSIDAVLHVGDFAYDMHSADGTVGDEFMRQIETIAAYVPYMVVPGNHEEAYNFSNYKARFSMPGGQDSLFYSFDLGPVHFIGFSTEVYYFLQFGLKPLVFQYKWLEEDLKLASSPERRSKIPWIITMGHRPMYCSNSNGDDCSHHNTVVRKGLPILGSFGLEELFNRFGVDVEIWAHEHCYERLWPIYNYTVLNGSYSEPYRNPKAPVHIITGAAGNKEGREPFRKDIPAWSSFHSQDFGYTRFKAYNRTHLHFEQVSDDKKGQIIDQFWVIKDRN
ncbi:acid phosphatase type 7 isoform X3 [Stomoxys calcitrans]|uniref:Purple acid phosphatase n=1 Tax=Stomoxys calcitrans TaxID=35570 RepID=A0A1I8Q1X8_STOCA|nr:acid phosphatase type 7 isoform X3 [Stomoxys calcitrans]XP_059222458.1 acid phosphatase type 7 isoform X3 [Stomoxys calcitrans]